MKVTLTLPDSLEGIKNMAMFKPYDKNAQPQDKYTTNPILSPDEFMKLEANGMTVELGEKNVYPTSTGEDGVLTVYIVYHRNYE